MVKFQRITLVFSDLMIDIDIDALPDIGQYETHLFIGFDMWIPLGAASSPDAALGYAAQVAMEMAGQRLCEIWVDPSQEFVSTADTLSRLARSGVWAKKVREL
nr:hypothetical protein [uncultured Halomonas sp.]